MSYSRPDYTRRHFLNTLALGTAAVSLPASLQGQAASARKHREQFSLPERPTRVFVQEDGPELRSCTFDSGRYTTSQTAVNVQQGAVRVSCPRGKLARVILRWEFSFPAECLFLGDHWERGYGDFQWRTLQPERIMPWYFAAHDPVTNRTVMTGVATQPSAFCFWTVDGAGCSLWLDFRNGGSPCSPGDREIVAAKIVSLSSEDGETPMAAMRRFCRALCPTPRLPKAPVCGNNNWYYAYGRDFDAAAMRRDAAFLAELAGDHANRPFCVVDAGWTPGSVCPGGPWNAGDPKRFPDMPGLAADFRRLGVRPGIWVRATALMTVDDPRRLRAGPCTAQEKPLDLTLHENLEGIRADIARLRAWGFELIKHDFSTYDLFGKWGFEMGAELTDEGWNFADTSLTNAEILLRLYRTLREGAGDGLLLGCNTVGHLGAGIFEVQRAGDDTSGRVWERTRRMGVNTLAFRLPQNRTFFISDPDCVAQTPLTPWDLDRQFLDLVARSGTALFVSIDPRQATAEQKHALSEAMQLALSGGESGGCEPLDWLTTTAPETWRCGAKTVQYHWEQPFGTWPLRV